MLIFSFFIICRFERKTFTTGNKQCRESLGCVKDIATKNEYLMHVVMERERSRLFPLEKNMLIITEIAERKTEALMKKKVNGNVTNLGVTNLSEHADDSSMWTPLNITTIDSCCVEN